MARGGIMGAAPRDGAISHLGYRTKEHPILLFLPVIDLLLLSLGRAATSGSCNACIASAADYTSSFGGICPVVGLFRRSYPEQAVCGYVASCARALRVVERGSTPIA